MELILRENVPNLGKTSDVVTVADGYARNYLIPKGLATKANKAKVNQIEHEKRLIQAREEKEMKLAQALAKRIQDFSCTISANAGDEDRLFGSVTAIDIAEALIEGGIELDRKSIQLEEPIKELGVYSIPVDLGKGVAAQLKVWVVRE